MAQGAQKRWNSSQQILTAGTGQLVCGLIWLLHKYKYLTLSNAPHQHWVGAQQAVQTEVSQQGSLCQLDVRGYMTAIES